MRLTWCICGVYFLTSCATTYRSVNPRSINYNYANNNSDIEFTYRYSVLAEAGNLKYHNRELKKKLHIVAVKITNLTEKVMVIGDNAFLYQNNLKIDPIDSFTAFKTLKQPIFIYLLYAFVAPYPGRSYNNADKYLPFLYAVGLGIPAFNMLRAKNSNKVFYEELKTYSLTNKQILPGETVYGLIPMHYFGYAPLYLVFE